MKWRDSYQFVIGTLYIYQLFYLVKKLYHFSKEIWFFCIKLKVKKIKLLLQNQYSRVTVSRHYSINAQIRYPIFSFCFFNSLFDSKIG